MNIKRNSARLVSGSLKALVKLSGVTSFGLVLFTFGLPMSGEWLAAAMPRVAGKCPPGTGI